jgi:hypothetical protein
MKRILLPLLMLLATIGAKANGITVNNNTACDYWFTLYTDGGNCDQNKTDLIYIAANTRLNFPNTSSVVFLSPECTIIGPDFLALVLWEPNGSGGYRTTSYVGPHYNWPSRTQYGTSTPCRSGSLTWTTVGTDVQVDIN